MVKLIFLLLLFFCNDFESEFIPSQTKILGVQWDGEELSVNVSKEISWYGGGNAMEYALVSEVLSYGFSIPEVKKFTLLIEGEEGYLPEGTQILHYSRDDYEKDYFCDTK